MSTQLYLKDMERLDLIDMESFVRITRIRQPVKPEFVLALESTGRIGKLRIQDVEVNGREVFYGMLKNDELSSVKDYSLYSRVGFQN